MGEHPRRGDKDNTRTTRYLSICSSIQVRMREVGWSSYQRTSSSRTGHITLGWGSGFFLRISRGGMD